MKCSKRARAFTMLLEDYREFGWKVIGIVYGYHEYNELVRLTDGDYTRERLVDTFEKIMVDYDIGQLRPLLQKAASAIATKFDAWENKNRMQYVLGMRHYSHGQMGTPSSRETSVAASQGTRRSSHSQPSCQASSRASTDSPAAQPSITTWAAESRLEPPKKKNKGR